MRIKHLSHYDLDGVGSIVVSFHIADTVDYTTCVHETINNNVVDFLCAHQDTTMPYDYVVITDISVSPEVAEMIEEATQAHPQVTFVLLDHHSRANWLNKYTWAHIIPEKRIDRRIVRTCGASLWYDYAEEHGLIPVNKINALRLFVEEVRSWDTWDWFKINNYKADELNSLLNIFGERRFLRRFSKDLWLRWNATEQVLVREERARIRLFLSTKEKEVRAIRTDDGLRAGLVFADDHVPMLANHLCRAYTQFDYVMVCSLATGRFHLRTHRNHVDVGVIADRYGGGGNHRAAGGPLDKVFSFNLELAAHG